MEQAKSLEEEFDELPVTVRGFVYEKLDWAYCRGHERALREVKEIREDMCVTVKSVHPEMQRILNYYIAKLDSLLS